jgi:ABC-type amino acid transport substrate-binding protein
LKKEEEIMKGIIKILGFLCSTLILAGCASPKGDLAAMTNPLRIGVAPDYPPIIFQQDGVIAGMEADLAVNLAKGLNRSYQFVELKWDDLIPSLLDGRIDLIMSGMSVTDERQVRIAFCSPYLKTGQMALIRRADAARYATTAQIMMNRSDVGVQRGTTGAQFVRQQFSNAKEVVFLSAHDAALALNRNRIDLVIHDAPVIWWLASENEARLMVAGQPLTQEYLAWGVRRDDQELMEAANKVLERMKMDGTLDRIFKRWMPGAP